MKVNLLNHTSLRHLDCFITYQGFKVNYFRLHNPRHPLQEILDFPTKLSEEISYELATKYSSESICQSKGTLIHRKVGCGNMWLADFTEEKFPRKNWAPHAQKLVRGCMGLTCFTEEKFPRKAAAPHAQRPLNKGCVEGCDWLKLPTKVS